LFNFQGPIFAVSRDSFVIIALHSPFVNTFFKLFFVFFNIDKMPKMIYNT